MPTGGRVDHRGVVHTAPARGRQDVDVRRVLTWVGGAALAVAVFGCGEPSNGTLTVAGVVGNNTGTFTIDTERIYTVSILQTDVNFEGCATTYCAPSCVITASFNMGSDSFTITAQPMNIKTPGFAPSYVTSGQMDEDLAAGTWNYTAAAQCGFDIDIYPPTAPSP